MRDNLYREEFPSARLDRTFPAFWARCLISWRVSPPLLATPPLRPTALPSSTGATLLQVSLPAQVVSAAPFESPSDSLSRYFGASDWLRNLQVSSCFNGLGEKAGKVRASLARCCRPAK